MPLVTPSILVVDDEADNCLNLVDIFQDLGYGIDAAYDGPSALKLVRERHYDLAFLDLIMPGMDGALLYEEIRRLRSGTVGLLLTAHTNHPRVDAAKSAGVWQVLSKPVDLRKLLAITEQALKQPMLLMVDDDEEFCTNLWDVLRDRGYRVWTAHDLASATRLACESEFKAVVVDMRLPDGDGFEVVLAVRTQGRSPRIVVVTGYQAELDEQLQKLLSENIEAVFPKPLDMPRLLQTLHELVS